MKKLLSIIVILMILIGVGGYYLYTLSGEKEEPVIENEEEEIVEIIDDINYDEYIANWQKNYAINTDYIGDVKFESGLVDLPFVCPKKSLESYTIYDNYAKVITDLENGCESGSCSLNDAYLRVDWETMTYNLGGSLFMDYRNSLYDQNIIIYGHHYTKDLDPERSLFFTGLEKLMKADNYEDNKYVDIYLEDEVRHYQVAYVYIFHINDEDYENLQYFRTNYERDYYGDDDTGYYLKYINKMEEVKLYDTGISLSTSDNTLTLQTCLENDSTGLEVVVCKQIGIDYYN